MFYQELEGENAAIRWDTCGLSTARNAAMRYSVPALRDEAVQRLLSFAPFMQAPSPVSSPCIQLVVEGKKRPRTAEAELATYVAITFTQSTNA